MLKLGFIGAGTVGTALAVRLSRQDYPVAAVSSRSQSSSERLAQAVGGCPVFADGQGVADAAELVFITTPDGAIPQVAAQVQWHAGQSVVHCSGADSAAVLEAARRMGAGVGCIHPLQTFASIEQAIENVPGSTFAVEAEEPLLGVLKGIAEDLEGSWVVLKPEDKVLYHTAAVMACNYMVTLVKLATDLWQTFNVPTDTATKALLPLIQGTIRNIEAVGLPQCLTGPVARGDTGTINKHIDALREKAPDVLPAYLELGRQTVPIALAKGKIDSAKAAEMTAIFNQHP